MSWRKETAGIWTVSKLIFYLVITNGQESAGAKDNLEEAYRSHGSVLLHAVMDLAFLSTTLQLRDLTNVIWEVRQGQTGPEKPYIYFVFLMGGSSYEVVLLVSDTLF